MYTTIYEFLTQKQPTMDQKLPIEILDIVDESITRAPSCQSMLDMLGDIGLERLARARFISTEEGNDRLLIFCMKQTADYFESDLRLVANKYLGLGDEGRPLTEGQKLFYWDGAEGSPCEACVIQSLGRDSDGSITNLGITFFDESGKDVDFDLFPPEVMDCLFATKEDVVANLTIIAAKKFH